MKKVLLIAFHFPPFKASSGIQRTLSMARYLKESDWEPVVLSVSPRAFEESSDDQLSDIPHGVTVVRAIGFDTARTFSIRGKYPFFLALPDRWVSWLPGAIIAGLRLIYREKIDVVWSTYPIATAHLIGYCLAKLSRIPWVADFRDSMTEAGYPPDIRQRRVFRWIEQKTVKTAKAVVFTTRGTLTMYRDRYRSQKKDTFCVVPNGYDESLFSKAGGDFASDNRPSDNQPLKLVHSGILYPKERDPIALFDAIADLKREGTIDESMIQVVLRATGHDALYRQQIADRQIGDIVRLKPSIGYQDALREMLEADGLLVLQASCCNHQIPAKIYEYLRSGNPVIALTDAEGDTAGTMREAGLQSIVDLQDVVGIKRAIESFVLSPSYRDRATPRRENAQKYSRRELVRDYSTVLDNACATSNYDTRFEAGDP